MCILQFRALIYNKVYLRTDQSSPVTIVYRISKRLFKIFSVILKYLPRYFMNFYL